METHGRGPGGHVNGLRTLYLHPGQVLASREPCALSTVLGSCVAICLFDPVRRVGGMNHFLLPFQTEHAGAADAARFSNVALARLLEEMARLGSAGRDLQAKVFGGANVLRSITSPLGSRNVDAARALLARERIPILGEDVGGTRGRRVVFHSADGTVLVKRL